VVYCREWAGGASEAAAGERRRADAVVDVETDGEGKLFALYRKIGTPLTEKFVFNEVGW
jgi:hypothetical protein